jgi:hypothetical protein
MPLDLSNRLRLPPHAAIQANKLARGDAAASGEGTFAPGGTYPALAGPSTNDLFEIIGTARSMRV